MADPTLQPPPYPLGGLPAAADPNDPMAAYKEIVKMALAQSGMGPQAQAQQPAAPKSWWDQHVEAFQRDAPSYVAGVGASHTPTRKGGRSARWAWA
jgi:hypothetical protein